ncbi:MAG TPA: hypothetical protein VMR06_10700 [Dokdonella sp.]|uniref:hypothetical protein n=1 Tax=Dokdonella sp. TaxID=2291710 RepID=UPI002BF684B9|nr:hypothetical protein [Dokdonella sp.]HUD42448.1 hypothetical protein [Dokdonella sp.]
MEAIKVIFFLLTLLLTNASLEAAEQEKLTLRAEVVDGILIAVLKNNSSKAVDVYGNYQSIDPEVDSGFFLEIKGSLGKLRNYCGMINQGVPERFALKSGKDLVFSVEMWVLGASHCLEDRSYTLRVIYINNAKSTNRSEFYSNSISFNAEFFTN